MGYTHYFQKKELVHNQKTWDKFLSDTLKVASLFKIQSSNSLNYILDRNPSKPKINIEIGDAMGDGGMPTFDNNEICFNGVGDDSHETFRIRRDHSYLSQDPKDDWAKYEKEKWEKDKEIFDFTKTNHKPYDLLVTAVMLLYKHHFKTKVRISGDGGIEGFEEGAKLVNKTLKYSLDVNKLVKK